MSLLTLIDNIPLYSTRQEALQWGAAIGVSGFHNHVFNGQLGYMSGFSHEDININLDLLGINLESQDEENAITNFDSSSSLQQALVPLLVQDETIEDESVQVVVTDETTTVVEEVGNEPQDTFLTPQQSSGGTAPSSGGSGY